ncbi:MAG: acyl-ACP--UDP-N-acetylglucosamine O-acyltransferase [Pseudomonadota bacterium]
MIHPTAIIEEGARIAPDVRIGPYSIIGAAVQIEAGCEIAAHVIVTGRTRIGAHTRIFQFASIGEEPQDKKYGGETSELRIGQHNTIREYVTINRGTADGGGVTQLGDHNWLMAYSHIAHDCQVGSHCIMANSATLAGHVSVGDHVIFAGFSGAHQFCTIGSHAFLGMYGGVNQDVPAYVMVSGQPPRPRSVNTEGLKRRGFNDDDIRQIKQAYKVLYRQGYSQQDALAEIKQRGEQYPVLRPMIDSIEAGTRGLLR